MSDEEQTEGILLKIFPFRDFDRIVTFFSPDLGMARFVYKGRLRKDRMAALTPLVQVELTYDRGQSDLLRCQELKIAHTFPKVRESWEALQAGCEMAQALVQSQYPYKPGPDLYALLVFFLQKLPEAHRQVATSFYLKTLLHEGLLNCRDTCAVCKEPFADCVLADGEPYCGKHAPPYGQALGGKEWETMRKLALSRSFAELTEIALFPAVEDKVKHLFDLVHAS